MSGQTQVWLVYIVGIGQVARTLKVAKNSDDFLRTTVTRFRELLHKKWSHVATDAKHLRLYFAGKELQDKFANGKRATLGDYNIQCKSTVQLIFRSRGEQNSERLPPVIPRLQTEKVQNLSAFYDSHAMLSDGICRFASQTHFAGNSSQRVPTIKGMMLL